MFHIKSRYNLIYHIKLYTFDCMLLCRKTYRRKKNSGIFHNSIYENVALELNCLTESAGMNKPIFQAIRFYLFRTRQHKLSTKIFYTKDVHITPSLEIWENVLIVACCHTENEPKIKIVIYVIRFLYNLANGFKVILFNTYTIFSSKCCRYAEITLTVSLSLDRSCFVSLKVNI